MRHLLLLCAGLLLSAAGLLVAVPLGLAVAGLSCGAAWWLLAPADSPRR